MSSLFRSIHKWTSLIVLFFFLWWLITGMFLQLRKPVDWIQPPSQKGAGFKKYNPTVTHEDVLKAAMSVPEANIKSWKDVLLLDTRFKHGMTKVRTYDWYEVQVDTQTAEVLSHGQRWNDIIGGWHSGASFGSGVLIIFTIASILTTALVVTGIYMSFTTTMQIIKDAVARKKAKQAMIEQGITPPEKQREPFNLINWCLKYHYYIGLPVFIPYLIVAVSGVALELRDLRGEYPSLEGGTLTTVKGSSNVPTLTFSEAAKIGLSIPELQAKKLSHIWRMYTYPNDGIITFRAKRHLATRAQIDASTGEILHVGEFTSDFWEDWHQGYFYEVTGDRKNPGFELDIVLDGFIVIHVLSFFLWLLGTIAVIKLTIFKPKS